MTLDIRHYLNILNENVIPLHPTVDTRTDDEKYDAAITQQKTKEDIERHLDIIRFYLEQDYSENLVKDFLEEWYASFSSSSDKAVLQYKQLFDESEFYKLSEEFNQKYSFDLVKSSIWAVAKRDNKR